MKTKRLDVWVKERTWLRLWKYRMLSCRERQVLDTLLCLNGIDTEDGWKGSIRRLAEAYEFVTRSKIGWTQLREAIQKLASTGLLVLKSLGKLTSFRVLLPEEPLAGLGDREPVIHGQDREPAVHDSPPPPRTADSQYREPAIHDTVSSGFTVPLHKRTEGGEACGERSSTTGLIQSLSPGENGPAAAPQGGAAGPSSAKHWVQLALATLGASEVELKKEEDARRRRRDDIHGPLGDPVSVRRVLAHQKTLLDAGWLEHGKSVAEIRAEAERLAGVELDKVCFG
jgi:hypothetical protein